MKCLKGFGLTVLIAIAALAIGSTSTAGAEGVTALCKQNESPCSAENRVEKITFNLKGTLQLETFPNILCLLGGSIVAEVLGPGEPQELHVTEFHFEKCGWGFSHNQCEFSNLWTGPSKFTLLRTASNLGVLNGVEGELFLFCVSDIYWGCLFRIEDLEMDFVGALHEEGTGNGMVTATGGLLLEAGGGCVNASLGVLLEPTEHVYVTE